MAGAITNLTELAWDLEKHLGPWSDPNGIVTIAAAMRDDEEERYPYQAIGHLQRWGVHEYCLPRAYGGRAGDVEVGFTLMRLVARRDPTAAIALMLTNLAFMPVWIAGTQAQKRHYTEKIIRGAVFAWGLSEAEHGSDVLANETTAVKVDGGWEITGGKDYIGNATVADVLMVQAQTAERRGPAGTSVFAVDRRTVAAGAVIQGARCRLHGIRAKDLGSFRLDRLVVPEDALIGGEGRGLEVALKGAQVARTTITSVSLSVVDTALRAAIRFAAERRLFGTRVLDVPHTRRQLLRVFSDLMVGEATCTAAVRGLQANPDQISVTSSVSKFLVPCTMTKSLDELATVIGARGYIRDDVEFGHMGKAMRDNLVAVFADGNTVVNLRVIASQLGSLLERGSRDTPTTDESQRLIGVFDLAASLPEWRPEDHALSSRTGDDAVTFLGAAVEELRLRAGAVDDSEHHQHLRLAVEWAERFIEETDRLRDHHEELREIHGRQLGSSADILELAERFASLHGAACLVHLFAWSWDGLDPRFHDGAVLCAALARVWRTLDSRSKGLPTDVENAAVDVMISLYNDDRLFSLRPIQVL